MIISIFLPLEFISMKYVTYSFNDLFLLCWGYFQRRSLFVYSFGIFWKLRTSTVRCAGGWERNKTQLLIPKSSRCGRKIRRVNKCGCRENRGARTQRRVQAVFRDQRVTTVSVSKEDGNSLRVHRVSGTRRALPSSSVALSSGYPTWSWRNIDITVILHRWQTTCCVEYGVCKSGLPLRKPDWQEE